MVLFCNGYRISVMLTSVGPMMPTLRCSFCGVSFCGIVKSMSPSMYVPGARDPDLSNVLTVVALVFTSSVMFHGNRGSNLNIDASS